MKRYIRTLRSILLIIALTIIMASTAFAGGFDHYWGSCSNNFNTDGTISGSAGKTGGDRCITANKSSWTSRIYSSQGACQASAMSMSPGASPSGLLNSKANSACYLNVKNPGGATLVIPQYYYQSGVALQNAYWIIGE